MESQILTTQSQIAEAINKLGINFKKDGAERRTPDYIKRRIETLTSYWNEYQKNHDRLCEGLDPSHSYFTTNQYDQTRQSYEAVRSMIERYRVESGNRSPLPSVGKQEPPQFLISHPVDSRPSTPTQVSPTPDTEGAGQSGTASRGTSSKVDEMLRKQSSNFRAFNRTVSSINLDKISEKWALEDALSNLQTRWSTIDKLHWDIDSELCGENKAYEDTYSDQDAIYNRIKNAINSKLWSTSHREKSTPKVELPVFHGSFQQFVSFKDLFYETIHNNPSLSPAQKMQFLKGKVKGEAEKLIQHLKIRCLDR